MLLSKPDYASEHLDLLAADRLHRLVLGLQTDVVGLAEVALDRGLLAKQRDDYVSLLCGLLLVERQQGRLRRCQRSSSILPVSVGGSRRRYRRQDLEPSTYSSTFSSARIG